MLAALTFQTTVTSSDIRRQNGCLRTPEMRASFMLAGKGITKGEVHHVKLIDVAPTLAELMGASLPDAEGRNILA